MHNLMRYTIFALLLFGSTIVLAQLPGAEAAMIKFQNNYNNKNGEAVFDEFSPKMQQSVNLSTTNQIITSFQSRFGELMSFDHIGTEGTLDNFEAHFERGKQLVTIAVNSEGKMTGLLFKPAEDVYVKAKIDRNITKLQLPFRGKWFTVWGGDTKAQNYHVIDRAQRHAFDFLIIGKNNRTYERSGTRNEDYYAFGKSIFAVCDAEVVQVITGVEDNKPGAMNPGQPLGNSVVLKTDNDEYIFYAHFEYDTVKVKVGDRVKAGQLLGNCGNSGNSSEPHLHLHIQDGPDVYSDVGVKCYFQTIMVNGELKTDYSPIRLDVVSHPQE